MTLRTSAWARASGLVVLLAAACTAEASDPGAGQHALARDRVVRDDRGAPVRPIDDEGRIVSLVPALTELVVALGGADQIVGRTRFDRDPRISGARSVGGSVDPDVEAVLGLRPDLVVTWSDVDAHALTERLRALGVSVYAARVGSIADFGRHGRTLGRLLGREQEAAALVEDVHRALDAVRVEVVESRRPSVLFVAWPRPLLTTGKGTFADELIRIAGGRGAFDDVTDPWPTVSLEAALRRAPDLIVVATAAGRGRAAWIERDPVWRSLEAVRRGHVYVVDEDRFTRPGPHMAEAAKELAGYVAAAAGTR